MSACFAAYFLHSHSGSPYSRPDCPHSDPDLRIPAMIFRISILILHIPTMITRIPIIFFIPFPDSPSRLLQIAKNIAKSLSKKQKADVISSCQH